MTKAENINDPVSCLSRAASDEPIFVLRAHDKLAPSIVRTWAKVRRFNRGMSDEAAKDAEAIAAEMERWRKAHG